MCIRKLKSRIYTDIFKNRNNQRPLVHLNLMQFQRRLRVAQLAKDNCLKLSTAGGSINYAASNFSYKNNGEEIQ